MNIYKTTMNGQLCFTLEGRLDTTTSPQLQDALLPEITGKTDVILDFSNISYVSSAGLRVLLSAQKAASKLHVRLILRGVCAAVSEVFEMTGFINILEIEDSI